jgi:hypothetical protein
MSSALDLLLLLVHVCRTTLLRVTSQLDRLQCDACTGVSVLYNSTIVGQWHCDGAELFLQLSQPVENDVAGKLPCLSSGVAVLLSCCMPFVVDFGVSGCVHHVVGLCKIAVPYRVWVLAAAALGPGCAGT